MLKMTFRYTGLPSPAELRKRHEAALRRAARESAPKPPTGLRVRTRDPLAFSYGRVSHADSLEGDSVPAQEHRTKGYYDFAIKGNPDHADVGWGGFEHDDKNISAYKRPFSKRPAGRRLMEKLIPGDHIIFDKVDRIWRSNEDFVDLMRWFRANDITVHFVSLSGCSIKMGTPMGDFMLGLFVNLAQLEAARVSERTKDGFIFRRQAGLYAGTRKSTPLGCKVVGHYEIRGGKKHNTLRLIWDLEKRAVMKEVVRLIDREGRSLRWVARELKQQLEMCLGSRRAENKAATATRVWSVYFREKALQWFGVDPDPNTINFMDLEKRYKKHLDKKKKVACESA